VKRALLVTFLLATPAFAGGHEEAVCGAEMTESADEQCLHYWEHHINWWSWDYKKPHDDPTHRHMPPPFGFALINFGIFAAIMWRLAGKPLLEYTRTRHLTIKKDLEDAARLHAEAEKRLKEYEAKIGGIDREIETLLASIRREAEGEKARIIAAAADQAARLKTDAEAQIQTEIARTQRALRQEMVGAAIAAAETILREKLGAEDQARLAERYVTDVGTPAARS
jgi:F-type H+-transporting ATPase subunit b